MTQQELVDASIKYTGLVIDNKIVAPELFCLDSLSYEDVPIHEGDLTGQYGYHGWVSTSIFCVWVMGEEDGGGGGASGQVGGSIGGDTSGGGGGYTGPNTGSNGPVIINQYNNNPHFHGVITTPVVGTLDDDKFIEFIETK
ncbi:hypothetical protein OX284_010425 [Flavobacterium sp. SUN046]|uniref:hypothetical protein n=1 Tax=Flavobacterium sp. SUN046 TaxID=3002440 RepID=UPI002DB75F26|nr:hypothetical protein [Flavobacterium sp. SUN046]MEC4049844.1 hypothetical protein [Flavobacterium sp. SUN046]